jgi:hypothetical protein
MLDFSAYFLSIPELQLCGIELSPGFILELSFTIPIEVRQSGINRNLAKPCK